MLHSIYTICKLIQKPFNLWLFAQTVFWQKCVGLFLNNSLCIWRLHLNDQNPLYISVYFSRFLLSLLKVILISYLDMENLSQPYLQGRSQYTHPLLVNRRFNAIKCKTLKILNSVLVHFYYEFYLINSLLWLDDANLA